MIKVYVLRVEHLLGELGHSELAILLGATTGERGEANHEEVKTRKGDQVDSKFSQISVELARKAQTSSHTRHDGRHKVVKITKGRSCEFKSAETYVVKGLVVYDHDFICVFDQLVN